MNFALLLSAGEGRRFGGEIPKQYVDVKNRPIIYYSLKCIEQCSEIDKIVIIANSDYFDYIKKIIVDNGFQKVENIVEGGASFQESVENGLRILRDRVQEDDMVMIQCAVSPNSSERVLVDSLSVCRKYGNAVSADPVRFPICKKDSDIKGSEIIDYNSVIAMNGPWTYKAKFICDLYERAREEGILDNLEPHTTSLMKYYGYPFYFSYGESVNIKITTKSDIQLFEALLEIKRD